MEGDAVRFSSPCLWKQCRRPDCQIPWHRPCTLQDQLYAEKLMPLVILLVVIQIVIGSILLAILNSYTADYDRMYGFGPGWEKYISLPTCVALGLIVATGFILLMSVTMVMPKMMWRYIIFATFLSIYIFALSVVKIHYSLVEIRKETIKGKEKLRLTPNTACVSGVFTLLGSLVHFMGTVLVFSYYNLKFLQPVLFDIHK